MTPPWWGIGVILVFGIALVWFGWWYDRRRNRRAEAALRAAPERAIPGLGDVDAPEYVTEDDIRAGHDPGRGPRHGHPARSAPPPGALGADARGHRQQGPSLDAGILDDAFLADGEHATAERPLVLVTDAPLADDRPLLAVLARARREDRPLVLVSPGVTGAALDTLRANHLTGRVRTLPVTAAEPTVLRRAVALTGGRLVPAEDLASGWLPDAAWGTCARWIADAATSWVGLDT